MSTIKKIKCLPGHYYHPKFGCLENSKKHLCSIGSHYDPVHIEANSKGCVKDTHTRIPPFMDANRPHMEEDFGKYFITNNMSCPCAINNLYYLGVS